ncbi:glyoxalase family protein [Ostertagia ostertagi]
MRGKSEEWRVKNGERSPPTLKASVDEEREWRVKNEEGNLVLSEVHTDAPMGEGARWLTVTPPDQPDLEITLFLVAEGPMFDKDTAETMKALVRKGTFGAAVFTCKDILATYEELKAKGVEFKKPPTKEFYGYEALFKDDSGNWFSLAQINS